jgi:TRAP-type transport system periplasmic protein
MTGQVPAESPEEQIQRRVGRRLRELRLAAGLTTADLAGRGGISQSLVSKIENGKATLSVKVLTRLCTVFDRPVGYLFQSRDSMPRLLGTLITVKGPENDAIQGFAELVRKTTDNDLALLPLRPSQIGPAAAQVEQLQMGLIDLFIEELFYFGKLVAGFDLFAQPYAFPTHAARDNFLRGRFFRERLCEPLRNAGIRLLNQSWNWQRGLSWVLVARQPLVCPDDLRGLRVRTIDNPVQQRFWEALGAIPVPVAWADVRAAMKSGDIDVLPTQKAHLYPLGFCRHAPFVTMLGDLPPVLGVAINESKYQALPPDIQAGLRKACEQAGDYFSGHVSRCESENEQVNIRRHKVAYLKVDLEPWRKAAAHLRCELLAEKLLDADTVEAAEKGCCEA